MYRACIAIADATRARLFKFEREAVIGGLRDQLADYGLLPARPPRPGIARGA